MTLAIFPCACARPSRRHASCLRKLAKAEWILWSPTARPTDRPTDRQAQEGHGRPRLTHSCLLAHQFYTGLITLQNLQPIIRNLILLSGLQVKLLFVGVADSAGNIDLTSTSPLSIPLLFWPHRTLPGPQDKRLTGNGEKLTYSCPAGCN